MSIFLYTFNVSCSKEANKIKNLNTKNTHGVEIISVNCGLEK